jgi:hypothetical protein
MSDNTINQSYTHLKLIRRVEKLGRAIEEMIIVAYYYKQMSLAYRQLALQCTELAEAIDQIDVAAFQVQQDYTFVRETLHE